MKKALILCILLLSVLFLSSWSSVGNQESQEKSFVSEEAEVLQSLKSTIKSGWKIAIEEITGNFFSEKDLKIVEYDILKVFINKVGADIINSNELYKIRKEKNISYLGLNDYKGMEDTGKLTEITHLLSGEVTIKNNTATVTIKIVNVLTGKIEVFFKMPLDNVEIEDKKIHVINNEAVANIEKSEEIKKDYIFLLNRGIEDYKAEQYACALYSFSMAIELDPNNTEAYLKRGLTYAKLKKYDSAISDYSMAIKLDPNNKYYYASRGFIYDYNLEQYDLASSDYSKVIQLDPDSDLLYWLRGNAYKKLKQYDMAVSDYSEAIRLYPDRKEYYIERADLYFKLNHYDSAVFDYSMAIKLDPDNK